MASKRSLGITVTALEESVVALIKYVLAMARDAFDNEFPMHGSESRWFAKVEDGGHQGHSETRQIVDLGLFWLKLLRDLSKSAEWADVATAIEKQLRTAHLSFESEWLTYDSLCQQTLNRYLRSVRSLRFSPRQARETCRELIEYCESNEDPWETLIAFEGLGATTRFILDAHILFRPISRDELVSFGTDDEFSPWSRLEPLIPANDWSLAVITTWGPKGTPDAHNHAGELSQKLVDCLPLFASGGLRSRELWSAKKGAFGLSIIGRGTRWTRLGKSPPAFDLGPARSRQLRDFWRDYLLQTPGVDHFLGLPARRLRTGVERATLEDSLVDYVIGLESLLSNPGEQTELKYRFAVRGAALLARTRRERYAWFKKLQAVYDLRSSVVHGRRADQAELQQLSEIAEHSLRKVWRWYFDNYRDSSTADRAVDSIDKLFLQS